MDVADLLDQLVPAAAYRGSLTANTEAAFDDLVWEDARAKPTWQDLLDHEASAQYSAERQRRFTTEQMARFARLIQRGTVDYFDAWAAQGIDTPPPTPRNWPETTQRMVRVKRKILAGVTPDEDPEP